MNENLKDAIQTAIASLQAAQLQLNGTIIDGQDWFNIIGKSPSDFQMADAALATAYNSAINALLLLLNAANA